MMLKVMDCAFQDGSYPCGYEDGGKLPDCELCHKIRKAGIREVVDDLDKIHQTSRTSAEFENGAVNMLREWQAKLKDWDKKLP